MCAGLPVICSEYADGGYDLIEEGKNGYLIDPYRTEEFRACIRDMLRDPDKAAKMGENAKNNLGKFRFSQVSKGFWDAFASVEKFPLSQVVDS
jgi:glycosyltransferase involved in cell wall biosynthesis